jgi:glycyl-tRNA synthetase beta chain
MGDIDETFLELPPEALQTSMREHQKFFSVRNPKTKRIEKFITVANTETADHGATILAGNQKVLFARLSDAKFFWENDLRTVEREGMKAWTDKLTDVTFHAKLGSQAERIARIEMLAREIAPLVGAKPDLAAEAARIAKADLASEMVYEFPELQGIMGRYYAKAAGHDDGVPEACEEHYSPLGPSDDVPTAPVSVAVALADKIDMLTGFWAIDEKPTGSKDPFALRRAALGVIRLLLESKSEFRLIFIAYQHLLELLASLDAHSGAPESAGNSNDEDQSASLISFRKSFADWAASKQIENEESFAHLAPFALEQIDNLISFFHDRIKVYLRDKGVRHDVVDACIAMPGSDDMALLVNRATALSEFLKTEDGENLLQGFKRANNILTRAEENDGVEYSYGADVKFAEGDVEKALFAALSDHGGAISSAIEAEDFAAAMHGLAALRTPIDAFFEEVQVNADSEVIRRNRLNLLGDIRKLCLSVADLGRVEG